MCACCGKDKKTLMLNVTVYSATVLCIGSKHVKTINTTVLFQSQKCVCACVFMCVFMVSVFVCVFV